MKSFSAINLHLCNEFCNELMKFIDLNSVADIVLLFHRREKRSFTGYGSKRNLT